MAPARSAVRSPRHRATRSPSAPPAPRVRAKVASSSASGAPAARTRSADSAASRASRSSRASSSRIGRGGRMVSRPSRRRRFSMAGSPASAAGGGKEATSPARTASVAKYCVRRVRRATSTKGLGLCGTPPGYRRPTAVDADRGHHTPRPRSRVAGRRSHAAASRGRHPRVCCASFSRAAGLIPPRARFRSARWDVWGSWDESGRGRVQICHKGAPRRDRPRRKARNTNDSSRALRLDPGLCGRFGQPAPLQARGEGVSGRFLNVIWI